MSASIFDDHKVVGYSASQIAMLTAVCTCLPISRSVGRGCGVRGGSKVHSSVCGSEVVSKNVNYEAWKIFK